MNKALSFAFLSLFLACSTQYAADNERHASDVRLAGGAGQSSNGRSRPYDKNVLADDKTRAESARSAAANGNASAQYNLALLYRKGRGVPQDDKRAVMWYEKAAAQGHSKAQANLGFMYENGLGVGKNGRKATALYQKSAAQGLAVAQFNLGVHYSMGDTLPHDGTRAYVWFSLAAENGYADAKEHRDNVGKQLTSAQKAEAEKLARELDGSATPERRL